MSAKTTEKTSAKGGFKSERRRHDAMSVIFGILSFIYLIPIFLVAMNSFKSNASINLETFAFPREGTFVALDNYIKGLTFGNYPFLKSAGYSLLITIVSAALILLCTSMAAWYIARVGSGFSKLVYYLCVFSMVVPFQMVMFTLARTADTLKLNTPYTIPIIYLGFGAGLAVFMFSGFIKSIPLEIEEAAAIDGCGPVKCFWRVMFPLAQPAVVTVTIFNFISHWNEYFMALIFANKSELRPIGVGLYQTVTSMMNSGDWAGMFASVVIVFVPTVVIYIFLSDKIISGVTAGGVKG